MATLDTHVDAKVAIVGGGDATDSKHNSRNLTAKQKELRSLMHKWRAERQSRLVSRLTHKQIDKSSVSTAIFGTMAVHLTPDKQQQQPPAPEIQLAATTSNSDLTAHKMKSKNKKIEVKQTLASRLRLERANPLLRTDLSAAVQMRVAATEALSLASSSQTPAKGRPPFVPKSAQSARFMVNKSQMQEEKLRPNEGQRRMTMHGVLQSAQTSARNRLISEPKSIGRTAASLEKHAFIRSRLASAPGASNRLTCAVPTVTSSATQMSTAGRNVQSEFKAPSKVVASSASSQISHKLPMGPPKGTVSRRSTFAFSAGPSQRLQTPINKPPVKVPLSEPKVKVPRTASARPATIRPVSSRLYPPPSENKQKLLTKGSNISCKQPLEQNKVVTSSKEVKRTLFCKNKNTAQPKSVTIESKLVKPSASEINKASTKVIGRKEAQSVTKVPAGEKKPLLKVGNTNSRRSLSTVHVKHLGPKAAQKAIKRSQSVPDLHGSGTEKSKNQDVHSPIIEEAETSPNMSRRMPMRSKSVTFFSPLNRRTMSPAQGVFTPKPAELREKLVNWLEKRGKSLGSFHHLHCFGVHASDVAAQRRSLGTPRTPFTTPSTKLPRSSTATPLRPILKNASNDLDLNKMENNEVNLDSTVTIKPVPLITSTVLNETITHESSAEKLASPELSAISTIAVKTSTPEGPFPSPPSFHSPSEEEDKENVSKEKVLVTDTLSDLQRLIQAGYPWEQCEQWLALIRSTHHSSLQRVTEMFQYWECLASLEEARCNYSLAVDYYGRAVGCGAQVKTIENSLDHLWEKFSTLNIGSGTAPAKKSAPASKSSVAKEIFKSSIIKFALQQKSVKKLSSDLGISATALHYVVTPVRRSTRTSRSQFRSTPTVTLVNTVDDLDPTIRSAMVFHSNSALEPKE